jgi:hypothetical protein
MANPDLLNRKVGDGQHQGLLCGLACEKGRVWWSKIDPPSHITPTTHPHLDLLETKVGYRKGGFLFAVPREEGPRVAYVSETPWLHVQHTSNGFELSCELGKKGAA